MLIEFRKADGSTVAINPQHVAAVVSSNGTPLTHVHLAGSLAPIVLAEQYNAVVQRLGGR